MSKENKPTTPVELASGGMYELIKFEKLTEKDILEFDNKGFTLLHYTAKHGLWEHLPLRLRDPKYWQESKNGDTVYMSAYHGMRQEWIVKKRLTEEDILKRNKQGEFIAWMATKDRTLYMLPKTIITEKVLKQRIHKKERGEEENTLLIHEIAAYDQITAIPKNLLTEELLSLKGAKGESAYHILATEGEANSIPKELWTKSALTLKADSGLTPLHSITEHSPSLIPKNVTLEEILAKTAKGETPLHGWARGTDWVNIPNKFLSEGTLHLLGELEETPLTLMLLNYKNRRRSKDSRLEESMRKKMTYIVSKLDKEALKSLKGDNDHEINTLAKRELSKRKVAESIQHRGNKHLEI